jgi:O-succinylhomoserine sulfhydrylase
MSEIKTPAANVPASKPLSPTRNYRPETRLVHSGTLRSQYGETPKRYS